MSAFEIMNPPPVLEELAILTSRYFRDLCILVPDHGVFPKTENFTKHDPEASRCARQVSDGAHGFQYFPVEADTHRVEEQFSIAGAGINRPWLCIKDQVYLFFEWDIPIQLPCKIVACSAFEEGKGMSISLKWLMK